MGVYKKEMRSFRKARRARVLSTGVENTGQEGTQCGGGGAPKARRGIIAGEDREEGVETRSSWPCELVSAVKHRAASETVTACNKTSYLPRLTMV